MLRLTRAQLREIDRRSIEEFHIPGIVLMENAARGLATAAEEMLGTLKGDRVEIFCGAGNNGGDGMALARHLHNAGADVTIILAADPEKYQGDASINYQIIKAMKIPCLPLGELKKAQGDLLIDALFGTGLSGAPRDATGIRLLNLSDAPVLSVDLPSGLDCDTGQAHGDCVHATRTVTFVAEKAGFSHPSASEFLGRMTVADIGCPRELIEDIANTHQQTQAP